MWREGWCQWFQALLCQEGRSPLARWKGAGFTGSFPTFYDSHSDLRRDQIWIWAMTKCFWKPTCSWGLRINREVCPLSNPVESAFRLHTHPSPTFYWWQSRPSHHLLPLDSCRSLCPTWPFCFYPTYPPFPQQSGGIFRRVKQISQVQWLRLTSSSRGFYP